MNYYNPYYYMMNPTNGFYGTPSIASRGIFSRLAGGFNWSSLLNNTQRTLGIINQAIPLVKQATPMLQNARTMFRVMNEFKKVDSPTPTPEPKTPATSTSNTTEEISTIQNHQNFSYGPTFFQ